MIYQCQKCGLSKCDSAMGSVLPQCKCDWIAPASKPWVGLTDEEIGTLANEHLDVGDGICGRNFVIGEIEFARAIEAKLRSKNT